MANELDIGNLPKYGRLTVIADAGKRGHNHRYVLCRCDCGKEKEVRLEHLKSRKIVSCGCHKQEAVTKHGLCCKDNEHPLYKVWEGIIARCENPNSVGYRDYGGRGIRVCEEWRDAEKFIGWAILNGWRKGLTINRIDNDGNYEPGNCEFTTMKVQARNKRSNHLITFDGKTKCLTDWAAELGISYLTLSKRINTMGWPIEKALTTPVDNKQNTAYVEWQGQERLVVDLAREFGIDSEILRYRVKSGWPIERALTEPVKRRA